MAQTEENFEHFPESVNEFSFNFWKVVQNSNENVFFSPLSISIPFAILYSGANGKSQREIASALCFKGQSCLMEELFKKVYHNN